MLSLTDIAAGELTEIGYFDVDPTSNAAQFSGSWSTYPYFESGTVVVTSIEDGIYIVRPKFIDVEVVNPSICQGEDLVAAALVVARDDRDELEARIKSGGVRPVPDDQARRWYDSDAIVWAVVVSPWVLVQEEEPEGAPRPG